MSAFVLYTTRVHTIGELKLAVIETIDKIIVGQFQS